MKALLAVDFSPVGREVAQAGYRIAQKFGMDVTFFHCAPITSRFFEGYDVKAFVSPAMLLESDNIKEVAANKLKKIVEDVVSENGKTDGVSYDEHIAVGDAAESIINYAKANGYDLIVIGYKSYSTLERLLVGSTADKVTRYAPCSVLVYRPDKETEKD